MTAIEQATGKAELAIVDLIRTSAERCTFKEMAWAVLDAVSYPALLDVAEAAQEAVCALCEDVCGDSLRNVNGQLVGDPLEFCAKGRLKLAIRKLPQGEPE